MVSLIAAVVCVACVQSGVLAGEQKIVLTDHIKKQWTHELVTFPFSAKEGQCHPQSVRLAGPDGAVPVQLSDVELWPGTQSVKSAKLSFIASLAPLASDTYTVHYAARPSRSMVPAADLIVGPTDGSVKIETKYIGVQLLLGKKTYARPVSASKVPGPIASLRLDDGKWFEGSTMYGKGKIRSYTATLVARGPVFAEVETRYVYADGNTLDLTLHVAAGDTSILVDAKVQKHDKENGWQMAVAPSAKSLAWRVALEVKGTNKWPGMPKYDKNERWIDVPLGDAPAGHMTNLAPWSDWWSDATQVSIRLKRTGQNREIRVARRDAGAWVTPVPLGTKRTFNEVAEKRVPLMLAKTGLLYLKVNNAVGWRKWAVGTLPSLKPNPKLKESRPHQRAMPGDTPSPTTEYPGQKYLIRYEVLRYGRVGRHLNEVKDWVLDWEEKKEHPRLYITKKQLDAIQRRQPDKKRLAQLLKVGTRQEVLRSSHVASHSVAAYLLTGDKKGARERNLPGLLDDSLAQLGVLDTWRSNGHIASLYDAVMAGDLVTGKQRKLLKARMAYLAYRSADPATWSCQRGYASGNLNMSVANDLLLGMVASAIPDNPDAPKWVKPATAMMEHLLATVVGPAGEWPESVAHYAHVSASPMLVFAVAAKNACLADFVNDPRMKRLQMFLAKNYSPPDPRHMERHRQGTAAVLPPVGRGPAGEDFGLHGLMAIATAESDPEYSQALQWVWMRGKPRTVCGRHMLGWEYACLDAGLPIKTPDWTLDYFPRTGAIMRHGLGTPNEWYVYLICEKVYTVQNESGTLPLVFAKGKPISSRFACSYPDREELLLNRVLLARKRGDIAYRQVHYSNNARTRKITDVVDLPRQQYLAGAFSIDEEWGRPLGPPSPNGYSDWRILPEWPPVPVEGKPGVKWRRQVLFVRDDDAGGVGYLVLRDTVVGGQPTMWQFWTYSEKIGTPKEAADRKRFLTGAPGNKIVEPRRLSQSDRYTALGQFGVDVEYYIADPTDTPRHTLRFGVNHAYATLGGYSEFQDLMHLQRPGDGAYFVVIFPRKQSEPAPTFETLAGGKVVKLTGAFGADLCFMSAGSTSAKAADAQFTGTVATVQDRKSGLVLTLGAKGRVRYKTHAIASGRGASLRVTGLRTLIVSFPRGHKGAAATVTAPGSWKLKGPDTATVTTAGEMLKVNVPAGVRQVTLQKS